jgi:hypothetical protein
MAAPAEAEAPEINSTLLSLVLIFIPGILCYGMVAALGEKKDRDNVTMFLQIFMYGVCSYILLAAAHWLRPSWFVDISALAILNPSEIEKTRIDPAVIAEASAFGIVQGLVVTLNLNYQILLKALRKIRVTGRFGDEDVWTLLLNSTATDNYVTIRHRENDLIYQGYVSGFSSGGERRELLVINVRVFSAEATDGSGSVEEVGGIPFLYLAFKEDDITLELGRPPSKSSL